MKSLKFLVLSTVMFCLSSAHAYTSSVSQSCIQRSDEITVKFNGQMPVLTSWQEYFMTIKFESDTLSFSYSSNFGPDVQISYDAEGLSLTKIDWKGFTDIQMAADWPEAFNSRLKGGAITYAAKAENNLIEENDSSVAALRCAKSRLLAIQHKVREEFNIRKRLDVNVNTADVPQDGVVIIPE